MHKLYFLTVKLRKTEYDMKYYFYFSFIQFVAEKRTNVAVLLKHIYSLFFQLLIFLLKTAISVTLVNHLKINGLKRLLTDSSVNFQKFPFC